MAYKDSDELKADERYPLGDYSFRIERTSVPGSTNDQITAICTKGGKNARKSIQVLSSTQLEGWYVEANETTADVYVRIKEKAEALVEGDINVIAASVGMYVNSWQWIKYLPTSMDCTMTNEGFLWFGTTVDVTGSYVIIGNERTGHYSGPGTSFTYLGKTVYVCAYNSPYVVPDERYVPKSDVTPVDAGRLFWTYYYGSQEDKETEKLVARFPIDVHEAGGTGPNSPWQDPDDWNEDPTTTLHLTVDGALSGRHNDPLNDTSYSYLPSDKATVKDYGCGGDGGNGGGGGGGASSIVVYKFATDRANSKEIVCKPKRHGYGSGGGKGGKGGDGCILVYY